MSIKNSRFACKKNSLKTGSLSLPFFLSLSLHLSSSSTMSPSLAWLSFSLISSPVSQHKRHYSVVRGRREYYE